MIKPADYKDMGAPVYPCNLNTNAGQAKQGKLGECRPHKTDGNQARQQLRQVCSNLFNKPYETPWTTLEVEDHIEWWAFIRLMTKIHPGVPVPTIMDGEITSLDRRHSSTLFQLRRLEDSGSGRGQEILLMSDPGDLLVVPQTPSLSPDAIYSG